MDSSSDHHLSIKTSKKPKSKKNTIKVVYFPDPMKVHISASNFRALVQELTGRDSYYPQNFDKFSEMGDGADDHPTVPDYRPMVVDGEPCPVVQVTGLDPDPEPSTRVSSPSESLDDVFTPEMVENFMGYLPSNLSYKA